jgi:hypothetical protein
MTLLNRQQISTVRTNDNMLFVVGGVMFGALGLLLAPQVGSFNRFFY